MTDVLLTEPSTDQPSRRAPMLFGVAAGALVAGALASTTALLVAGYRYAPERRFEVTVTLQDEATDEQKSAIRAELAELPAGDEVRFETREQALARYRKSWEDDPERVAGVQVESMSEAFHVTATGRDFDCSPIPGIRELAGVERTWVVLRPNGSRPGAELAC